MLRIVGVISAAIPLNIVHSLCVCAVFLSSKDKENQLPKNCLVLSTEQFVFWVFMIDKRTHSFSLNSFSMQNVVAHVRRTFDVCTREYKRDKMQI